MRHSKNRRRRKFPKKIFAIATAGVLVVCLVVFIYLKFIESSVSVLRPIPLNKSFNLSVKEDERISEIRTLLNKEKIKTEEIKMDPSLGIVVKLEDNGEIYLSEENYPAELTSLQVILKRLTMEGKRFKRLDLRYERPIIVL